MLNEGSISRQVAAANLEVVAVDCMVHGDLAHYESHLAWIVTHLPECSQSPRFLGNYAHALQVNGNLEESLRIRKQITTDFPLDQRHGEHLLEVANMLSELGRLAEAKEWYERVAALPANGEKDMAIVELAEKNLSGVKARLQAPALVPMAEVGPDRGRKWILGLNAICIVAALAAVTVWIYRSH
jgi:tetratricopeptide (TPR) repeat protein